MARMTCSLDASLDKLTSAWTGSLDGTLVASPSVSQNPYDPRGPVGVLMRYGRFPLPLGQGPSGTVPFLYKSVVLINILVQEKPNI